MIQNLRGYRHGVFHLLEVKVEKQYPLKRDELYDFLKKKGITTGVHYPPLHFFSYYQKDDKIPKRRFSPSRRIVLKNSFTSNVSVHD